MGTRVAPALAMNQNGTTSQKPEKEIVRGFGVVSRGTRLGENWGTMRKPCLESHHPPNACPC
eukprot:scaffold1048_cov90-Amphora_coffeaeformis.AAC.16